jgi:hypothetical protein
MAYHGIYNLALYKALAISRVFCFAFYRRVVFGNSFGGFGFAVGSGAFINDFSAFRNNFINMSAYYLIS